MRAEVEISSQIHEQWKDPKVADWVVDNLPLLEFAGARLPCPVYELGSIPQEFKTRQKLVASGGFEGTRGHLDAALYLWEIRALTSSKDETDIIIMLEPDSYVHDNKHRQPIVDIKHRSELWATSGLVDYVVQLPDALVGEDPSQRFHKIHELIAPAKWCTNIENPYWREILTREGLELIDVIRLFIDEPRLHTSFLSSTMLLTASEVLDLLPDYFLNLVKQPEIYKTAWPVPPEEIVSHLLPKARAGLD